MAARHDIIIVHGMGDLRPAEPRYSTELEALLTKHMGARANDLHYHVVDWSAIGEDEQNTLIHEKHVLPRPQYHFDLSHPVDTALEAADQLFGLSTQFRTWLFKSVGDVLVYLTPPGKELITDKVKRAVFEARDQQVAANIPPPHYVSILAHSLGSVVVYDVARYFGATTCHLSGDNVPVPFGNAVPALFGNGVPAPFGNGVPAGG